MNGTSTSGGLGLGAVHGALPERQRAPGLACAAWKSATTARSPSWPAASLSHRFAQNGLAPGTASRSGAFLEHLDHEVIRIWQRGDWADFCGMLPEYASKGHGEGFMHDTAMLLGALGWSDYDAKAEIVTPYFGASAPASSTPCFPVTPPDGAIPKAVASA